MIQLGNPVDRVKDRWSLSKGSFILEPDPKVKVALLRSGSSATHLAKLSATHSPCRKSQPKTEEWIKNWSCFSHPTNTFKCLRLTVQQSSSKNITFGSMMVYDGRCQFLGHFGALSPELRTLRFFSYIELITSKGLWNFNRLGGSSKISGSGHRKRQVKRWSKTDGSVWMILIHGICWGKSYNLSPSSNTECFVDDIQIIKSILGWGWHWVNS